MTDFFIFFIGCLVTLVIACAVGLLLWGAAQEPRFGEAPKRSQSERQPDDSKSLEMAAGADRPVS